MRERIHWWRLGIVEWVLDRPYVWRETRAGLAESLEDRRYRLREWMLDLRCSLRITLGRCGSACLWLVRRRRPMRAVSSRPCRDRSGQDVDPSPADAEVDPEVRLALRAAQIEMLETALAQRREQRLRARHTVHGN